MTRRTRTLLEAALSVAVLAASAAVTRVGAQEAECTEHVGTVSENFDATTAKDPSSSVANWPAGPIRLNKSGGNFGLRLQTGGGGLGAKFIAGATGLGTGAQANTDFTGDGYPDLIAFDRDATKLSLLPNEWNDADGDGWDDDNTIYRIDHGESYGNYDVGSATPFAALTTADYTGDGKRDFFFVYDNYAGPANQFGTTYKAILFVNNGTTTDPNFVDCSTGVLAPNLDFTPKFKAAGTPIYPNTLGQHLFSIDMDKDGDFDILACSQDKVYLLKNPGATFWDNVNKWDFAALKRGKTQLVSTGFTTGRGTTCVVAGDFDGDNDIDVVAGSVEAKGALAYLENDGTGYFTKKDIAFPAAYLPAVDGPAYLGAADFNGDGRLDIFGATDPVAISGNQARIWIFRNQGLSHGNVVWQFRWLNGQQPVCPSAYDVDLFAALDYDKDGDLDVLIADAGATNNEYYFANNGTGDVYGLHGEAISTDLSAGLDPASQVITRVTVTSLGLGYEGTSSAGLGVALYVSNDDGANWELYGSWTGAELTDLAALPTHDFVNFGKHLRFKLVLTAEDDLIFDSPNASYDTPTVRDVAFEYVYVDRREYARSSIVAASVEVSPGRVRKMLIAGTFVFPGWQGHLQAYDVTDVAPVDSRNTQLRTVSRSTLPDEPGREVVIAGGELSWDAADLLNLRTASSRTIYTAVDDGSGLTRLDFTTANVATLGPLLEDFDNDPEGLIGFVRGENRTWKLGDIDHSTPILVGPPSGSAAAMGAGYDEYKAAQATRIKVLYVGANDGMLHAFDPRNGEELWAYVPNNLLPKLKNMWPKNTLTGLRYEAHDSFVDGSPAAADVYIGGAWKTVVICGQGKGKGSLLGDGLNYYFALDVTDPANPRPLWEFTDISADYALGETWSVPAIGKVTVDGAATWMAFMGSGYDNDPGNEAGKAFYGIRIADGAELYKYSVGEYTTTPNIVNAVPASPSVLDTNNDGFVERVYFADLDGRVYRLDASVELDTGHSAWTGATSIIYTDDDHRPIISKPLGWIDLLAGVPIPKVYFGTGGDDAAPATATYSFVCVLDETHPSVEWYMGDSATLNLPEESCKGALAAGEKVWADPVIPTGDGVVYFTTLAGNIENVNPCLNLGVGKLYARFIQVRSGTTIGGSAFTNSSTGAVQESLTLASKARKAVTVGDRESTSSGLTKRDIYVQEYDSTIQKIEQAVGSRLKVKSWREVYKILR